MGEENKRFYLNDIIEIDDKYFILNGWPQYDPNEDLYYEIHIKSNSEYLNMIKHYVDDYIFVDLISENKLEIYYGEFDSECCSDGTFSYTNYLYKETEKTSKNEWKLKFKDLQRKFDNLLNERFPSYMLTRNEVVHNYQSLYKEIVLDNDYKLDKSSAYIFGSLNGRFKNDIGQTHDLYALINSNKKLVLFKDWKLEYSCLNEKYNNLLKADLNNYTIIKNQIIDIYTKLFNGILTKYILPNLGYGYKEFDKDKCVDLFELIIKKLSQIEN